MSDESPVKRHYYERSESDRIQGGVNNLERVRMKDIMSRFLPDAPSVVRDVGGGPGFYATWLAKRGYDVHLLDLVPLHIEQARERSEADPDASLAEATVGDARDIPWSDGTSDAVLLMGPLYHLQERGERLETLREALRVLRPGGRLLVSAISRFASTYDGVVHGRFDDPTFVDIAAQDRETGCHDNPTDDPSYFTEAYYHLPEELEEELRDAGFEVDSVLGVEGPAWMADGFDDRWEDEAWRERAVSIARDLESEPSLTGASVHMMAVADRPAE